LRKNNIRNSLISWIPFGVFIFVICAYFSSHFIGNHKGYWKQRTQDTTHNRSIASYADKLEFDAYKHYFVTNSFNKFLNFKLTTSFWNNLKDPKQEASANLALRKSLNEIYASSKESVPMVGLFRKDFLTSTIDNFINNLSENNITSGKFQINLNFTPQFEQELNYKKELNTTSIIHINDLSLKKEFERHEKKQIQTVLSTPIPITNEKYQYSGGSISIIVKALDLTKGLYTGHIRYRRYFRANSLTTSDLNLKEKNLSLDYFKLDKIKGQDNNYITVDLFKTLKVTDQQLNNNLEIHFGKLVSSERETHIPQVRTGDFYLNGTYPVEGKKTEVKIKIEKINYSFKTDTFTDKSKFIITFRDKNHSLNNNYSVKEIIKKNLAHEIITKLKLSQFHSNLKKSVRK
jgi:hypothetical protein